MYASHIFVGKEIDSVSANRIDPTKSRQNVLLRCEKQERLTIRFQICLDSKSVLCTNKPQRHIESVKVKYGKREVGGLKSEVR